MHTYSLYAVMNLATFPELPLNSCGLATSTCVLGHANVAAPSAPPNPAWVIIAYSTASYSCCCYTTYSSLMLCRLMVYGSSSDGDGDDDVGGGVGTAFELKEPILCWTQFLTCILFTKSL